MNPSYDAIDHEDTMEVCHQMVLRGRYILSCLVKFQFYADEQVLDYNMNDFVDLREVDIDFKLLELNESGQIISEKLLFTKSCSSEDYEVYDFDFDDHYAVILVGKSIDNQVQCEVRCIGAGNVLKRLIVGPSNELYSHGHSNAMHFSNGILFTTNCLQKWRYSVLATKNFCNKLEFKVNFVTLVFRTSRKY